MKFLKTTLFICLFCLLFSFAAAELPGVSETSPVEVNVKFAVLVVGSNVYDPEDMHIAFANAGERVYSTLLARGYTADNIMYLSWDYPGNPNVDAEATAYNIQVALENWLHMVLNDDVYVDTVVIYFIDHGTIIGNEYNFVANNALIPESSLVQWINNGLMGGNEWTYCNGANIVFETCYSGKMINRYNPPYGLREPKRVIVTSTDAVKNAYSWWAPPQSWYDSRPTDSNGEPIFTYYFTKAIMAGKPVQHIYDSAFNYAHNNTVREVQTLSTLPGSSGTEEQDPQIYDFYGIPFYW